MPRLSRRACLLLPASLIPGSLARAQGPDAVFSTSEPPTDAAMIAHLATRRAGFEELVAMIEADGGLTRVDDNWTDPRDPATVGVPPDRIADYRRRCVGLGVPRGFMAVGAPRDRIYFYAYGRGLSIRATVKGYVWSRSGRFGDGQVVGDLDGIYARRERRTWAYRHVEGPWWLHLRHD